MNIYEDDTLERKLEELSDQMGHLVLDILLMSLKKVVRENEIFSEITDARLGVPASEEPF
jgi:hypothetical protein